MDGPEVADHLAWAAAEAALCGVTRLADVTRLDRIGTPVFQAIRPWGRALSVHQGKGLTPEAAQIGALMEAVESDHAERFDAPRRACAFDELPADERAPSIADFSLARGHAASPDAPRAWAASRRLDGGGVLWVPFESVSLDYTWQGDPRLDRTSNGLGARFDLAGAILKGLLEVIERDADCEWQALPIEQRSLDRLDLESVPYDWFEGLHRSVRDAGLRLAIYRLPAVIALPAIRSEIVEFGAEGCSRGAVYGTACHPSCEEALLGSLLEAVQGRATLISGARDDIFYSRRIEPVGFGSGLPLPPHIHAKTWEPDSPAPSCSPNETVAELVSMLRQAGYPLAAAVELTPPDSGVYVVKVLVPGLGAFERRRRRLEICQ